MKTLLFIAALLVATPAQAFCGKRSAIQLNLGMNYGEVRQGGRIPGSIMKRELYANPVTQTWTIIENYIGGRACIIGKGRGKPPARRSST